MRTRCIRTSAEKPKTLLSLRARLRRSPPGRPVQCAGLGLVWAPPRHVVLVWADPIPTRTKSPGKVGAPPTAFTAPCACAPSREHPSREAKNRRATHAVDPSRQARRSLPAISLSLPLSLSPSLPLSLSPSLSLSLLGGPSGIPGLTGAPSGHSSPLATRTAARRVDNIGRGPGLGGSTGAGAGGRGRIGERSRRRLVDELA